MLEAAGSKWNFLRFSPGLVGGHCIGVDPYYLTYKAEMLGLHPEVILSGRRINDNMAKYVAEKTIKLLIEAGHNIRDSRIGVLGLTFKEDCPDLRNSQVIKLVRELQSYGAQVWVDDALADPTEAEAEYGLQLTPRDRWSELQAMVATVPHRPYLESPPAELTQPLGPNGVFVDVKSAFPREALQSLGHRVWCL